VEERQPALIFWSLRVVVLAQLRLSPLRVLEAVALEGIAHLRAYLS